MQAVSQGILIINTSNPYHSLFVVSTTVLILLQMKMFKGTWSQSFYKALSVFEPGESGLGVQPPLTPILY